MRQVFFLQNPIQDIFRERIRDICSGQFFTVIIHIKGGNDLDFLSS